MSKLIKPENYKALLDMKQTEQGIKLIKEFYGMSTKRAQKEMIGENVNSATLKTSEGRIITQPVVSDLRGWVENETAYLRSAMSYTNSHNLSEYKDSGWVITSNPRYNN